jgi:hypothetical protein
MISAAFSQPLWLRWAYLRLIGLALSTRLVTYEQRTALPLTPPVVGD